MAQRIEQGPWLVQLWVQLGPAGVDGQRCHHRSPSIVAVDGCKRLRAKRLLLAHLGVEIACCNDQGCGYLLLMSSICCCKKLCLAMRSMACSCLLASCGM